MMRSALALSLMMATSLAQAQVIAVPASLLPQDVQDDLANLNRLQSEAHIAADIDQLEPVRRKIAEKLLGRGYDLWRGAHLFEPCVDFKSADVIPVHFPPGTVNNDNAYVLRQIKGAKEHYASRSRSLSGSATYKIFSIGGSDSEYSDEHYKSTSDYIDAYIISVGHEYTLYDGVPSGLADKELGDRDPKSFPKVCGQAFISKVGFGTKLDGEVDFEVTIDENAQKNQSSVDAGIKKILSFGAEWGKSVSDMTQYSSVSTRLFGGGSVPTPEQFLDIARRFRDTNYAYISQQEVLLDVTPYSQLGNPKFKKFVNVGAQAEGTIQKYSWDRVQTYQQISDLHNAANAATANFFKLPGDLPAIITKHEAYLNALGDLFAKCEPAVTAQDLQSCKDSAEKIPSMPIMPAIPLANQK